ncbi:MAG: lysine--tRNA ligase, partial [Thermoplasmata archaeon]|nr:lysine--tRNA ligase [Thermoplasmata archaeon]
FKKYLGQPAFKLPCPDGCCSGFVEHFTRPFLESLERIDVRPEAISVAGMYADGKYDKVVKVALERASEIRQILEEISGSERAPDWLPFFPICESCGRILTTQAYEFDGEKIKYRCAGGVAGKARIPGCGHEGEVGIRQGKLPWRIEWAARWSHLGVTCEPMGKDLTAAGGTYETSKLICERIYDFQAPLPVPYEFIVMGGKKLGKSIGRILTIGEMIDIATPEISRYFFFRSQPTTHKEIDFELGIQKLAEDYEQTKRVFFGLDTNVPEKELDDIKRTYEISQVALPDHYFDVAYSHLTSIVQTYPEMDRLLQALHRTEGFADLTEEDEEWLDVKVRSVKNWLDTHAPEDMKFSVQGSHPEIQISDDEKALLKSLSAKLENLEWKADRIHDAIHSTAVESKIKAGAMFRLMYRIFLGKEKGPRLGYLLASLDRDFVLGRIRHFSA